jgi:aspartate/methionine/tyrosine aminotransferase
MKNSVVIIVMARTSVFAGVNASWGVLLSPTVVSGILCGSDFDTAQLAALIDCNTKSSASRLAESKQEPHFRRGARMRLKPFLLDTWLDQYEHGIEFNLAASTGPTWTVNDILALADEETRHRFLNHKLVYSRPAGADALRQAIADMQGVPVESVQVVTGSSEALVALMWLAAEPGANVIVPLPGFTTFSALPESLGLQLRFYRVRRENGFRIDPDEIKHLADSKTKLILINSPHNPTGATIGDEEMEDLHEFTAQRGIQLISDEVYHPIYHGCQTRSAARLPHATVIADLSKAFSIAGVRTGWMIEHNTERRQQYWTARAYFSICNTTTGEILSEIAIRKHDVVLGKAQQTATRNLKLLERFMADHRDVLGWIPPQGGMTAFPWLLSGENARPFCQAAAERGILLAPGDCFDVPSHFRIGFAAAGDNFSTALDRFGTFVHGWSAKRVTA